MIVDFLEVLVIVFFLSGVIDKRKKRDKMLEKITVFLVCMLPTTFIFAKMIIDERGLYKLKAIAMWIVLYDFKIIFSVDNQAIKLSVMDCGFIIIGLILGYVYVIIFIVKSKDPIGKLGIIFTAIYIIYVFSVAALETQQIVLVYIFKMWLMLTLLLGLIALRDFPALGQIIGAIIVYILMIGANAMISMQFLSALSEDQFWKGIYETVQRSYCLNSFNSQMSEIDVKTYIVDFFLCKVMDMILLGFLSARFMEIVGESKARIKYSDES